MPPNPSGSSSGTAAAARKLSRARKGSMPVLALAVSTSDTFSDRVDEGVRRGRERICNLRDADAKWKTRLLQTYGINAVYLNKLNRLNIIIRLCRRAVRSIDKEVSAYLECIVQWPPLLGTVSMTSAAILKPPQKCFEVAHLRLETNAATYQCRTMSTISDALTSAKNAATRAAGEISQPIRRPGQSGHSEIPRMRYPAAITYAQRVTAEGGSSESLQFTGGTGGGVGVDPEGLPPPSASNISLFDFGVAPGAERDDALRIANAVYFMNLREPITHQILEILPTPSKRPVAFLAAVIELMTSGSTALLDVDKTFGPLQRAANSAVAVFNSEERERAKGSVSKGGGAAGGGAGGGNRGVSSPVGGGQGQGSGGVSAIAVGAISMVRPAPVAGNQAALKLAQTIYDAYIAGGAQQLGASGGQSSPTTGSKMKGKKRNAASGSAQSAPQSSSTAAGSLIDNRVGGQRGGLSSTAGSYTTELPPPDCLSENVSYLPVIGTAGTVLNLQAAAELAALPPATVAASTAPADAASTKGGGGKATKGQAASAKNANSAVREDFDVLSLVLLRRQQLQALASYLYEVYRLPPLASAKEQSLHGLLQAQSSFAFCRELAVSERLSGMYLADSATVGGALAVAANNVALAAPNRVVVNLPSDTASEQRIGSSGQSGEPTSIRSPRGRNDVSNGGAAASYGSGSGGDDGVRVITIQEGGVDASSYLVRVREAATGDTMADVAVLSADLLHDETAGTGSSGHAGSGGKGTASEEVASAPLPRLRNSGGSTVVGQLYTTLLQGNSNVKTNKKGGDKKKPAEAAPAAVAATKEGRDGLPPLTAKALDQLFMTDFSSFHPLENASEAQRVGCPTGSPMGLGSPRSGRGNTREKPQKMVRGANSVPPQRKGIPPGVSFASYAKFTDTGAPLPPGVEEALGDVGGTKVKLPASLPVCDITPGITAPVSPLSSVVPNTNNVSSLSYAEDKLISFLVPVKPKFSQFSEEEQQLLEGILKINSVEELMAAIMTNFTALPCPKIVDPRIHYQISFWRAKRIRLQLAIEVLEKGKLVLLEQLRNGNKMNLVSGYAIAGHSTEAVLIMKMEQQHALSKKDTATENLVSPKVKKVASKKKIS